MKNTGLILLMLLFMFYSSFAQMPAHSLAGMWEKNQPQMTYWPMNLIIPVDTFPNKLKFYADGTFAGSNFYQSNNSFEVVKIKGDYKAVNDFLILSIKTEVGLTGNTIEGNNLLVEIKNTTSSILKVPLKYLDKSSVKCILLNNYAYYQTSSNPNLNVE